MNITKKQIVKTAVLPGIIPRIKHFFNASPINLAYLIALVYSTVRILPNNHQYLQSGNIGTYGIRQVISEAANHITPSRKNIDQIIIFMAVLVGLVILLIQFILLAITIFVNAARAEGVMPTTIQGFFTTPEPSEDIAFGLLDLVFGIPDLFGSKYYAETPFHTALHGLFEFYSLAMLFVAGIIIVYYIIAVVAETAQSGIPFGHRFNKTWAPIRIILFFALLLPLTNGLNAAQYMTLNVAKLGSGLASTGWLIYNDNITETLTGTVESNFAKPSPPDISYIPAFMLIAKTCQQGYYKNVYTFRGLPASWDPTGDETGIRAWVVYKDTDADNSPYKAQLMSDTTFQNISATSRESSFRVVFGIKDPLLFSDYNASVFPICGSLNFNVTDISQPGSAVIQTAYYDLVKNIWENSLENLPPEPGETAPTETTSPLNMDEYAEAFVMSVNPNPNLRSLETEKPGTDYRQGWIDYLEKYLGAEEAGVVNRALAAQIAGTDMQVSQKIRDYGWGGAGIWYNQIAIQNGALVSALQQAPTIISYPDIMEKVYDLNLQETANISRDKMFAMPATADSSIFSEEIPGQQYLIPILNESYLYWDGSKDLSQADITPNALINAINVILGTSGLFEMCANADVHPLAQLSSVGRSMVESSIRAYISAGLLSVASIIPNPFSGAAGAFASFFGTVGSIGLLVGFILFYILPFLPFLYFFFAVGGWVKSIFEAMVAMPLWALGHLRIDSESIPGEAALQGYYLLLEIFLRPILIVFGLFASITIFSASVKVLNDIFYLAISNLAGHEPESGTACFLDPPTADLNGANPDATETTNNTNNEMQKAQRGPVDEFFFTVLYTIVVYLLATTSFKMIDMLPNNILRWINAEVPSFGDNAGDNAEGLVKYIALAGSQFGGDLSSSIGGVGKGLQGSVKQGVDFMSK